MAEYKHSVLARRDLLMLAAYGIRKFGSRRASDYLDMLEDAFSTLGEHPNPGLPTHLPRRKWRLFRLRCGSHVIYYRKRGRFMFIVRILHKSQLPALHL